MSAFSYAMRVARLGGKVKGAAAKAIAQAKRNTTITNKTNAVIAAESKAQE